MLEKKQKRYQRHKRVRAKISGTDQRPRLGIFKSARHIYAQLIDDEAGKVLASASDLDLPKAAGKGKAEDGQEALSGKTAKAFKVGKIIAKKAEEAKIKEAVFDRGGYKYHGRVKALADGAREGGLKF